MRVVRVAWGREITYGGRGAAFIEDHDRGCRRLLELEAARHQIGPGGAPGASKLPLPGTLSDLFDRPPSLAFHSPPSGHPGVITGR
jgi:hypothetical protein